MQIRAGVHLLPVSLQPPVRVSQSRYVCRILLPVPSSSSKIRKKPLNEDLMALFINLID